MLGMGREWSVGGKGWCSTRAKILSAAIAQPPIPGRQQLVERASRDQIPAASKKLEDSQHVAVLFQSLRAARIAVGEVSKGLV